MAKLVRDGIPEVIRAKGGVPIVRVAGAAEYSGLLRDKLREEAGEAAAADRGELAGELADVLEVVSAIAADAGITPEVLAHVQAVKAAERGGFADGVVWLGNEGEPAPRTQSAGLASMLREGHARFGAPAPMQPTADVDPGYMADRDRWLRDEVNELAEAVADGDLEHIAKEGADVIYMAAGTLTAHGIDPDAAVAAVHASNVTKEPGGTGKAIKGPGYREADMTAALRPTGDFEAG